MIVLACEHDRCEELRQHVAELGREHRMLVLVGRPEGLRRRVTKNLSMTTAALEELEWVHLEQVDPDLARRLAGRMRTKADE